MTLTLATPTASPITTLPNGMKIVRCADYIGAARGTLSVVSDSLSVAGTVVRDEQSLAPATTFSSRWTSVADSVTIPYVDLDIDESVAEYRAFLGLRSEGSTPVNSRFGEEWNVYINNIGPTVQLGRNGNQWSNNNRVPKWIYEHYSLLDLAGFGKFWDSGTTTINIRAWGITNVADPMSWYLDVLYLVPRYLANTDEYDVDSFGQWSYQLSDPTFSPTDPSDDIVTNTLGRFSVLQSRRDIIFNNGGGLDIQTADDEDTESDWRNIFGSDGKSYLTIVGCGSRLIKPHTILNEVLGSGTPYVSAGGIYQFPDGNILLGTSSPGFDGWEVSGGVYRNTAPNSIDSLLRLHFWSIGIYNRRDGFSSGDPRTYAPQIGNLESFIETLDLNLESGYPTGGDIRVLVGVAAWTTQISGVYRQMAGVEVRHKTDGTSDARLVFREEGTLNDGAITMESAGPTTVLGSLSAGGTYHVKVERRYYHWRAKIWLDGDTEPSSWLLEAHEPVGFFSIPPSYVQYPYTSTWPGFGPENIPNMWPSGLLTNWAPGGYIAFEPGFDGTSPYTFWINNLLVEYDPGVGDYTGAFYRIEKYDGSIQFGNAYVPPGAIQVLYTDYAEHHFVGDTHGGNLSVWKESGAKLLQGATYGLFYWRRKLQNPATFNKIVSLK